MKRLPLLIVLWFWSCVGISTSFGQVSGRAGTSPQRPRVLPLNRPPTVTADLDLSRPLVRGREIRFRVSVADPEGDRVHLTLLTHKADVEFVPVMDEPGLVEREVRWWVRDPESRGRLIFEAHDDVDPERRIRFTLEYDVVDERHLLRGDVTGDGNDDLVVRARSATVDGIAGAGAIYVWNGGSTPNSDPDATLTVPGAADMDGLGDPGVRLFDLDGDGILDVLAATARADVGGVSDAGAVYFFAGGPSLSGDVGPSATFVPSSPEPSDLLAGTNGIVAGMFFADVTADGRPDLICASPLADHGGVTDSGALYVWDGNATLAGIVQPLATLHVPGATVGDELAHHYPDAPFGDPELPPEPWVDFADVTGDGALDIIVPTVGADPGGVVDAGAIYVWSGPIAAGTHAPSATLLSPTPAPGDAFPAGSERLSLREIDVSGDGVRDIVASSANADVGGEVDVGVAYLWLGGASLVGTPDPTAVLAVPGAGSGWKIGEASTSNLVADLTGDGLLDIVLASPRAWRGTRQGAGALYVWHGRTDWTIGAIGGQVAPDAKLHGPAAQMHENLGRGTHLCDVTGDGIPDVVTSAPRRSAPLPYTGRMYVWAGGPQLAGTPLTQATIRVPPALAYDYLDSRRARFGDVTGDGYLDMVVAAPFSDIAGITDAGAVNVFRGGPSLQGSTAPQARLFLAQQKPFDSIGLDGMLLIDLNADGVLDVITHESQVDLMAEDAGAHHAWWGGPSLAGTEQPDATFSDAGAASQDQLGSTGAMFRDVSGDGHVDLVTGSYLADREGVADAGVLFTFVGGPPLSGNQVPTATHTAPTPGTMDMLGFSTQDQRGGETLLFDLTGNGHVDLVAAAPNHDSAGTPDTGAVFLWQGPIVSTEVPVTLSVPGASPGDRLGD